jgi:hypothetical protein
MFKWEKKIFLYLVQDSKGFSPVDFFLEIFSFSFI